MISRKRISAISVVFLIFTGWSKNSTANVIKTPKDVKIKFHQGQRIATKGPVFTTRMQLLINTAMSYVNTPYKWGGDDPSGIDCSGLVQEILASIGEDPKGDQTAQKLFEYFEKNGRVFFNHFETISDADSLGALAFYGKNRDTIKHVGFIVGLNPLRMVEAGGGGRHIRTIKDAIKHNAYVRVRPVSSRKDLLAIIRPHYRMMRR